MLSSEHGHVGGVQALLDAKAAPDTRDLYKRSVRRTPIDR
jgi:hypothetical protein